MAFDGLRNLKSDGKDWIERSHRVLENHRNFAAMQICKLILTLLQDVLAIEVNFTAHYLAWRACYQAHYGERCNTFAAAAFSYHSQGITRLYHKGNIVYRFYNS